MLTERVLHRSVTESGTDMSVEDRYKWFYLAAEHDLSEALRLLIGLGVNVNKTNERGDTALHLLAAAPEFLDTQMSIRAFLEGGVQWAATDREGRTPLQVAKDACHDYTVRTIVIETLRYVIHLNCL